MMSMSENMAMFPAGLKALPCDCCKGIEGSAPEAIVNPPGESTLRYRVGTHASFLETMKARLSRFPELVALRSRDASDPAIAFLDGWACIADVLSFYQERIANEGYLRTAIERYSLEEMARLVGYRPRPGVSATVFLAFQMETDFRGVIPEGTRAQSLPGQDQLPQPFETAEVIEARHAWNDLAPRRRRPQRLDPLNAFYIRRLTLAGVSLNLKSGDPLLLTWGNRGDEQVFRVVDIAETDSTAGTTTVTLRLRLSPVLCVRAMRDVASYFAHEAREFPPIRLSPGGSESTLEAGAFDRLVERFDESHPGEPDVLAVMGRFIKIGMRLNHPEVLAGVRDDAPGRFGEIVDFAGELSDTLTGLMDGMDPVYLESLKERIGAIETPSGITPDEEEGGETSTVAVALRRVAALSARLSVPASTTPRRTPAKLGEGSGARVETGARLVSALSARNGEALYAALSRVVAKSERPVTVHALRATAALFGHNAQQPFRIERGTGAMVPLENDWTLEEDERDSNNASLLFLERDSPDLREGDWAVVATDPFIPEGMEREFDDDGVRVTRIGSIRGGISRAAYNLSGKTTALRLVLPNEPGSAYPWRLSRRLVRERPDELNNFLESVTRFVSIRRTVVHTKSEPLSLADEPIRAPIAGDRIALDTLYEGLAPGRRVIVSGERADLLAEEAEKSSIRVGEAEKSSVRAAEVTTIAAIEQTAGATRPGDTPHTILVLAAPLAYSYRRAAVVLHGNVARATHGETREEILGSGDASAVFQRFSLRQIPLTHVTSPLPSGEESTLRLYVEDVRWHEAGTISNAGPDECVFAVREESDGKATLLFGDGRHGARLPTGQENVRAVYRIGIGTSGNVVAEQISQLATRPLGVKSVINPAAASGGADAETLPEMRRRIPLSLASLERLISVPDYAAFARVFAGVGKASAARLTGGRRTVLQVTVAGEDDLPIDPTGDLFRNLRSALRRYGDPMVPLSLRRRERVCPLIAAKVRIGADYLWEKILPAIRDALRVAFSFERRDLGQPLFSSELLAVAQAVPGVDAIDLDTFLGVSESDARNPRRLAAILEDAAQGRKGAPPAAIAALPNRVEGGIFLPAQVVYIDPVLPETVILNPIA